MKIRNGFVSNSSSSSFIISSKQKPKAIIEIDVERMANKIISNITELEEYILDEYGYKTIEGFIADDDWNKKTYDKMIEAINLGNKLYCGVVSSDGGEEIENYIYYNGWGEDRNFDVIQGDF